uniref:Uncharacterized protein n=1 Tax=Anguilla anguilla TaxID=7936 RepID=A0A0E9SJ38_ANGAN
MSHFNCLELITFQVELIMQHMPMKWPQADAHLTSANRQRERDDTTHSCI